MDKMGRVRGSLDVESVVFFVFKKGDPMTKKKLFEGMKPSNFWFFTLGKNDFQIEHLKVNRGVTWVQTAF